MKTCLHSLLVWGTQCAQILRYPQVIMPCGLWGSIADVHDCWYLFHRDSSRHSYSGRVLTWGTRLVFAIYTCTTHSHISRCFMVLVPYCINDGSPQLLTPSAHTTPLLFTNNAIGEWSDYASDLIYPNHSTEQWNAARTYLPVIQCALVVLQVSLLFLCHNSKIGLNF